MRMNTRASRLLTSLHRRLRCSVLLWLPLAASIAAAQSSSYFELTATRSPDGYVTLQWLPHANDTGYTVYRRHGDPHGNPIPQWPFTGWTRLADNAPPPLNILTDPEPLPEGEVNEYCIIRHSTSSSLSWSRAVGAVGENVDPHAIKGRIVVVVETAALSAAAPQIERFERDLMLDGWPPTRVLVTADESVVSVRAKIKAIYDDDPDGVKAAVLLGRVPIPYSGSVAIDGHSSHTGAWPADTYYGAMTTTAWTDTTVNTGSGRHRNVPGDGKFDQDDVDVEIPVGRIDLRNMPAFDAVGDEYELLRRYLDRNHAYRKGALSYPARGVFRDGLNEARVSVENYRTLFGAAGTVFTTDPRGYAAANRVTAFIGTGGGSYTSVSGVGTTISFRDDQPQAMLFQLGGSGLGIFDTENNILKACLSLDYGLLSVFSIRPSVVFPHAGLGYHIGYDFRKCVNYPQFPTRQMALLGDPTLRFNMMQPVPRATHPTDGAVEWEPVVGADGYIVYTIVDDRLDYRTTTTELTYDGSGTARYAIAAFRNESTATGSYRNQSQAVEAVQPAHRSRGFLFILTGAPDEEAE